MTRRSYIALAITLGLIAPRLAEATVSVNQVAVPTTYSTTLNFDEPGGPVGAGLPDDAFLANGITSLAAGDGNNVVDDNTMSLLGGPWVGTGNSFFGNFGIFINFEDDLSEFSGNFWDPSGPPGPFGGGLGVFVFDDGVEVTNAFFEPAWGGLGLPGIEVTTTDGMVFDEVRVLGFGFSPTTFGDDFSWNVVPEPSSMLGLCFAAVAALVLRRRN